jgi:SnoaL-like domain
MLKRALTPNLQLPTPKRAAWKLGLGALCVASLFWSAAAAQQASTVTEQDRADIQALVARYQTALSTCASQEYASLFVPDGVFISDDFRGKRHREMYGPDGGRLVGRAKLAELVDTEDFCLDKSRKRAPGPSTPPKVAIVPAPGGARGTIELANNGRYEDEYVKTSDGWRFKVRRVVMPTRPAGGGEK